MAGRERACGVADVRAGCSWCGRGSGCGAGAGGLVRAGGGCGGCGVRLLRGCRAHRPAHARKRARVFASDAGRHRPAAAIHVRQADAPTPSSREAHRAPLHARKRASWLSRVAGKPASRPGWSRRTWSRRQTTVRARADAPCTVVIVMLRRSRGPTARSGAAVHRSGVTGGGYTFGTTTRWLVARPEPLTTTRPSALPKIGPR